MEEEYKSLADYRTWDSVKLPKDMKAISWEWVYQVKRSTNGNVSRYKARSVARDFAKRFGINYSETFSPVVRLDTIRILLAIATAEDHEIFHFGIKTAFSNGKVEEELYMVTNKVHMFANLRSQFMV